MLDEPKANASTQGYRTAGRVVAPAAGKVIARVGPMLGLMPELANAAQINAQLAIPLQPARPPNAARTPPVYVAPKPAPPPGPVTACKSILWGILLVGWLCKWNSTKSPSRMRMNFPGTRPPNVQNV